MSTKVHANLGAQTNGCSKVASWALLEEARSIFLFFALRAYCWSGFANDAFCVKVIIINWALWERWSATIGHDGDASLYASPFTISLLLHCVLTCRQRLDVRYDYVIHDFILTAERRGWELQARQLFLIVQWLFPAVVQNVTVRFCKGANQIIIRWPIFWRETHQLQNVIHTHILTAGGWLTGVHRSADKISLKSTYEIEN